MTDETVIERFGEKNFPKCYKEYADLLDLVRVLAHDPRQSRPAVLEVVRRRQDQRLLQLRRPAPGEAQEQDGDPLRPRAGGRGDPAHHLPGAVRAGQRVRGAAARLLRPQDRRPRHAPHADDRRAPDHDARLRPARASSTPRSSSRVLGEGVRRSRRRLQEPRADHQDAYYRTGKLIDHKEKRRHRRGRRGEGRPEDREGPGLAALPRASTRPRRRWSRAATSSSTTS